MKYKDQEIVCVECGLTFIFSSGQQEFYAKKGFSSPPRRCIICRQKRKHQFHSDGRNLGYRNNYDYVHEYRGPAFRNSDPSRLQLNRRVPKPYFEIICALCGKQAEVPFRPKTGKPVYCQECYNNRKKT